MISLLITDQKDFTGKLFGGETFDKFIVAEAEFVTAFRTTIHCSGADAEDQLPVTWAAVRPVAYRLLQGNKLPRRFRVSLRLTDEAAARTAASFGLDPDEEPPALFMNVHYERGALRLVTGCSRKTFTLDRTLDESWDEAVKKYLSLRQIMFDQE